MICYITVIDDKRYLNVIDGGQHQRFDADKSNLIRLAAECTAHIASIEGEFARLNLPNTQKGSL